MVLDYATAGLAQSADTVCLIQIEVGFVFFLQSYDLWQLDYGTFHTETLNGHLQLMS